MSDIIPLEWQAPESVKMIETQKGIKHAFYSGYQYRPVSFIDDIATFRCVKAGCPARLKIALTNVRVTKDHSHTGNPRTMLVAKAKFDIKNSAKNQIGMRPAAIISQSLTTQNEGNFIFILISMSNICLN